jgi:hypothetical protein
MNDKEQITALRQAAVGRTTSTPLERCWALRIYAVMCSFFKPDEVRYRHGTCYKLFYGRIYCIQKDNWLGNFGNIFETNDKKVYENKVREMMKSGLISLSHN